MGYPIEPNFSEENIMKEKNFGLHPNESNIIDLRDRGICEECQIKVIEALIGKNFQVNDG